MSRMESWMSEAFLHGEKICKKVKENKVQGLKWRMKEFGLYPVDSREQLKD